MGFVMTYDMALYPLASPSALVVDIGYNESSVMGLYGFHIERRSFGYGGQGARAFHLCVTRAEERGGPGGGGRGGRERERERVEQLLL